MHEIKQITDGKREYIDILLIGDEQEDMVLKYLDRSELYVLYENGEAVGACAVTDEGGGVCELKNISLKPEHQRHGYGRMMIEHIASHYADRFDTLTAGTGDSPLTVPFYEKCGFERSHVIKDFFTENYDHPIIECGVRLGDMIYFRKPLKYRNNGGRNAD